MFDNVKKILQSIHDSEVSDDNTGEVIRQTTLNFGHYHTINKEGTMTVETIHEGEEKGRIGSKAPDYPVSDHVHKIEGNDVLPSLNDSHTHKLV